MQPTNRKRKKKAVTFNKGFREGKEQQDGKMNLHLYHDLVRCKTPQSKTMSSSQLKKCQHKRYISSNNAEADPAFLNRGLKFLRWVPIAPVTLNIRTERSEQTMQTQIRRRRTRRLIWVYTVCHSVINFRHVLRWLNELAEILEV